MPEKAELFWIVWNPAGRNPQFMHRSEDAARTEAKRLAAANVGQSFFVMQPLAVAAAQGVTVTEFPPPIPF